MEEKGLKSTITEGRKEGKSKAITSCKYLEERFQECSMKGVALETSVEMLRNRCENRNPADGGEGECEKKKSVV